MLPKPPSHYQYDQFTCNACRENGSGFVYNCAKCSFDLHVDSAALPETVIRKDYADPLKLLYSNPFRNTEFIFTCNVCGASVDENAWVYYCRECDFGTNVECAYAEAQRGAEETEEESFRTLAEAQEALRIRAEVREFALNEIWDDRKKVYKYRYI
ncbi:OLC1v1001671C1 [Oldenlandia corymbosa var. corymbosa]|uniref:OLC1v1001671C1 n=1 Tax=Oldenlandia corymbosa var. corymbosa TaxID=529605 RepID=A0AAV1D6I8_OLDCO|nr:OLC1v1001671C1 [Oldenlandia corymbosa var. corymbosa]